MQVEGKVSHHGEQGTRGHLHSPEFPQEDHPSVRRQHHQSQ